MLSVEQNAEKNNLQPHISVIIEQGGSLQRDLPSSQSKTTRASPSLGIGLVVYDFIIYISIYKKNEQEILQQ